MNTKHFFNDAELMVQDALRGITYVNQNLIYDAENKSLIDSQHDGNEKVTLISGGGAGHEPAFAGFVGRNMLSAAISGFCFASPSTQQVHNTVLQTGGSAGTLLIIMNYTGDILHFHLAAEKARISGKETGVLVVGDDVSVGRKKSGRVGRRGLAGTILVHKILGAAAAAGVKINDLVTLGKEVVDNLATVGAALGHVHIPGRAIEDYSTADQVELGMGIHNEPGCRVILPAPSVVDLVGQMLDQLCDQTDTDRAYVNFESSKVALLINNLGGMSQLEFGAITKVVVEESRKYNCNIARTYAGTFMTSLDSHGFSISLLRVNDEMLRYLDIQTFVPGWSSPVYEPRGLFQKAGGVAKTAAVHDVVSEQSDLQVDMNHFKRMLSSCCDSLLKSEAAIDSHDALVGDGDCGSTLGRAARAIQTDLATWPGDGDVVIAMEYLARSLEQNMDGTSGALYSIFFSALTASLKSKRSNGPTQITEIIWGEAAREALGKLYQATPARPGDRTLIDALAPFVNAISAGQGLHAAMESATSGKDMTKGMPAAFGRAVYVPETSWDSVPDPGAEGVVCIVQGLLAGQRSLSRMLSAYGFELLRHKLNVTYSGSAEDPALHRELLHVLVVFKRQRVSRKKSLPECDDVHFSTA